MSAIFPVESGSTEASIARTRAPVLEIDYYSNCNLLPIDFFGVATTLLEMKNRFHYFLKAHLTFFIWITCLS